MSTSEINSTYGVGGNQLNLPSMQLNAKPLDVMNYINWSSSAKLALSTGSREYLVDNPLNLDERNKSVNVDSAFINAICQEVVKILQGKQRATTAHPTSSHLGDANFAGKIHDSHFSLGSVCATVASKSDWIVDTGASDHMVSNLALFSHTYKLHKPVLIGLPDGSLKHVLIAGTVHLSKDIILEDVLYVPEFKLNLLSVSKLVEKTSLDAHFTKPGLFILRDPVTKRCLVQGKMEEGLYRLPIIPLNNVFRDYSPCNNQLESFVGVSTKADDYHILHTRFGHSSASKLSHMHNVPCPPNFMCDTCMRAKFHRLPFPRSSSIAKSCFDLVHMDLWGPYRQHDITGAHYVLTVLDDHSRALWAFPLKDKL